MARCSVRWRPSGGRGEFEFVPAAALLDRRIRVVADQLRADIDSEVYGAKMQGKPRLRKVHSNDRSKMHLVQLVMAMARLPEPAREDKTGTVDWPLEDGKFVVSSMDFQIVSDDAAMVTLRPLYADILHSDTKLDIQRRFDSIADDLESSARIREQFPALADAVEEHQATLMTGLNSSSIRKLADRVLKLQVAAFGKTNSAAVNIATSLPQTPLEDDIQGNEGKILTRLHSFRERDRRLVKAAKRAFVQKHGYLFCECCRHVPETFYGPRGKGRIQAHHRVPLEQLVPDSITRLSDLAMVCPNCHDIIHAMRPWMKIENLKQTLLDLGSIPADI